MQFLPLRALFLLAFVVAMPVMALPSVARRIDELLYPPPKDAFSQPLASPDAGPAPPPVPVAESVSPALWQAPVEKPPPAAGLESPLAAPPSLPVTPAFAAATAPAADQSAAAPQTPGAPQTPAAPPAIDPEVMQRLEAIRMRLEQLGAQYVLVEAFADGRQYRCFCQMQVDPRSSYTRPFEATAAAPLDSAQQVLREVEAWRAAAAQP